MYCQPAYRVSTSPASRPAVAAVAPMPLHALSALLRSPPSANMFVTMDSAAGSRTAAPRPWMPRMMIRKVSLVASAQASEAAVQVGGPAPEQQEPAEGQRVGGHHPLQVLLGEVQLAADGRQGHVDDGQVDDHHEECHDEQRECPPAARTAGDCDLRTADVVP